MRAEPAELARLLADTGPIDEAAKRISGKRIYLAGTGTSLHAANQGAYLLRLAGAEALAVSAADCALWGPAAAPGDALVLLSHRGTKRYTSQVLARARDDGVATVTIGGIGSGADIETVAQERSATFTLSHLAALMRLAQLARTLGAKLDLEAVPDAVAAALAAPRPASRSRFAVSTSSAPAPTSGLPRKERSRYARPPGYSPRPTPASSCCTAPASPSKRPTRSSPSTAAAQAPSGSPSCRRRSSPAAPASTASPRPTSANRCRSSP
jgi:D-arabinose 5-phosphate isomerase GutQ